MRQFTLTEDAKVMGDKDPQYGYTLWGKTEDGDIMFNSQKGSFVEGTTIVAETATPRTSKKGTDYLRLSKVKELEGQQTAIEAPTTVSEAKASETGDRLLQKVLEVVEENNDMLRKLIDNEQEY